MTIKVNVRQVGYTSESDWRDSNRRKAVCKNMGYVEVENANGWEEDVWNLLNWSCWNYDSDGNATKPECVHSPLHFCNSDVILQIEGTDVYRCAKMCGWGTHKTLKYAVRAIKTGFHNLWPFSDAK